VQIFMTADGSQALPFLIDPLVMYWNRDLFAAAGIPQPPRYWNELHEIARKITAFDEGSNLRRSAVALGGWENILGAKEILSTLIMQAGDPIVSIGPTGALRATLGSSAPGVAEGPAASALRFYTEFGNPSKESYSWNRSLPLSRDAFAAGDLAIYFGAASDYRTIAARNPNLRFGVELVPQPEGSNVQLTFGRLTGLAVPRTAQNPTGALAIAQRFSAPAAAGLLYQHLALPPVRRDIAVDTSSNAALGVFIDSALISRAWHDPNPPATNAIFKAMVESVMSGRAGPTQAVFDARQALEQLVQ
jgi:multiple sugar transport system substrate-binding protein